MCSVCGNYRCSPACPMFIGQSAYKGALRGECGACGILIYFKDKYIRKNGIVICSDCADEDN